MLTNWKTSAVGALTIATGLAGLFGVTVSGTPMSPDAAIGLIVAGFTGLLAKDSNVTGGTVKQ